MVNDGKFICKRFFANFEKLKREVESEEAFFFNDDGVYCQVGTSIFDRWEQVTLIDPEWDKAIDDDEKRASRRVEAPSRHRRDSWPSRDHVECSAQVSDSIASTRPNAYPSERPRRRRSTATCPRPFLKVANLKMI